MTRQRESLTSWSRHLLDVFGREVHLLAVRRLEADARTPLVRPHPAHPTAETDRDFASLHDDALVQVPQISSSSHVFDANIHVSDLRLQVAGEDSERRVRLDRIRDVPVRVVDRRPGFETRRLPSLFGALGIRARPVLSVTTAETVHTVPHYDPTATATLLASVVRVELVLD